MRATRLVLIGLAALAYARPALAEPFENIRIGDKDGFGFTSTRALVRASAPPHNQPADTNRDGTLGRNEFLPDLNADGGVAWVSSDNFDNRGPEEIADQAIDCMGCMTVNPPSAGSIWTDLSLSLSSPNVNWPDADGPRRKLLEELAELDDALATGQIAAIEAELGDVLFSVCNLARHVQVNPEMALRATADRFRRRFAHVERELGPRLGEASLEEKEELWQQAKNLS